jgi:TPR repeat protein
MRSYDVALKEAYLKWPNWSRVMKALARAHRDRDARASYALGVLYYFGDHVEVDVRRGLELIQVGARRGSLDAQFFIGVALELGWHGWKRNDRRAFSHYIGAGSMGHKRGAVLSHRLRMCEGSAGRAGVVENVKGDGVARRTPPQSRPQIGAAQLGESGCEGVSSLDCRATPWFPHSGDTHRTEVRCTRSMAGALQTRVC